MANWTKVTELKVGDHLSWWGQAVPITDIDVGPDQTRISVDDAVTGEVKTFTFRNTEELNLVSVRGQQ